MAKELSDGRVICEQCGETFKQIGQHWSKGQSCSHPPISDEKMEILTGMVMGDGSINRQTGKTPHMLINMITKPFLQWLDRKMGWLSTGVVLHCTAEESARENRESGFNTNAKAENYSDVYRLCTRSHPQLQDLAEWYSSGGKVFPDDIMLTPTILKMWYVSDGHFDNSGSRRCIELAMSNERNNKGKIEQYFKDIGIEVGRWNSQKRSTGRWRCKAVFHKEETQQLFDYMGDPPPGFEYKWSEGWDYETRKRSLSAVQQ